MNPFPLPIDVISIQSQVVYGSVGSNIAVPILRKHNLQVASVPTVLLSNNPSYPTFHGGAIPLDWFEGFLNDLIERNTINDLKVVVVGYLGSSEQTLILSQWFKAIKKINSQIQIIIDPVIGDIDTGVYVSPSLIEAYQSGLLSQANGITPNLFELELLVGHTLETIDETIDAAKTMLQGDTEWVIVTSAISKDCLEEKMEVAIVNHNNVNIIEHLYIPSSLKGTGDLFCAELVAQMIKGTSLVEAAEKASQQVITVLKNTQQQHYEELFLSYV